MIGTDLPFCRCTSLAQPDSFGFVTWEGLFRSSHHDREDATALPLLPQAKPKTYAFWERREQQEAEAGL